MSCKVLITVLYTQKPVNVFGKFFIYFEYPLKLLEKYGKKSWKTLDFLNYKGVRTLLFLLVIIIIIIITN